MDTTSIIRVEVPVDRGNILTVEAVLPNPIEVEEAAKGEVQPNMTTSNEMLKPKTLEERTPISMLRASRT